VTALPSVGPAEMAEKDLSARLDALAELVRIGKGRQGQDGFSKTLLDDSETLLRRAGERLRLSSSHTVIALAGGTGSGKSTLFNTLSGASFSPPGVTRPTTRHVHACVWGMQGAAPLLDWLGVQRRHRYARASELDSGETVLNGLLLIDLPDHDSVVTASMAAVDRLSKLADMLIWVLDPQKYADAAVHNRYLIPLAGHASVFTVVLNQTDLLSPDQITDCENDLRRLLDAEGLTDTPLLAVSARTGAGLDELRSMLAEAISANHAAGERISADIDSLVSSFAEYAAGSAAPDRALLGAAADPVAPAEEPRKPSKPPWEIDDQESEVIPPKPPWEDATLDEASGQRLDPVAFVPDGPASELTSAFARAAGLVALSEAQAGAREAQAARFVGWPLAALARRRRDPVRTLRPLRILRPLRGTLATPAKSPQAQQSEVDNAITAFAGAVGGRLPAPWAASLRDAARSKASAVPAALADAVHRAVPGRPRVPAWWWLIAAWQWLLTVLAVAGVAWAVVIAVAHGGKQQSTLLGDVSLIPWLVAMALAMVLLGALTASGCQNMVLLTADRERDRAEQAMREQVAAVAAGLVLVPVGHEIAEYEHFRRELAVAQGTHGSLPATGATHP
jgi:GTP-binding protein EngB required for normal cell division